MPQESKLNRRIKILHIIWAGVRAGAEKNMVDIVAGLNGGDFDMEVLFFSKKGYWGYFIESKGIRTYCLQLATARSPRSVFLFLKFLLNHKYDIYHNHVSPPFVKIILKMLRKRVIQTIHNNPVVLKNMGIIKRKLTIGFADFYVAPSRYIRDYFEKHHNIKAEQIYHGINVRPLKRRMQSERSICEIGTLTRLEKIKGNDILITTVKILVDKGISNFRIHIAGRGKEYDKLKSLINNLSVEEYVEIVDFVENTEDFLDNLDIYVSASLCESLGISILEAMGRGLPVVCTDISAFSEMIINNINGFICQPSFEAIARNLEKLINNEKLREELGKASYKIASEKFNLDNMLNKYREFYLGCAAQ